MSHEIETMAWANKVPWHGLGVNVDANITTDEMLVAAGLDWEVDLRPLYFQKEPGGSDLKRAHNRFGLVRTTDLELFDVCTERWQPTQNHDVLDFFRKFVAAGDMTLETAGSLRGGRFIWALAKLDNDFKIGKDDTFKNYLLLMSPHQVGYALLAQYTPVRVVCANTMSMAIGADFKGGGYQGRGMNGFRMSHVRTFDDSAKADAEKALGLAREQIHNYQESAQFLAGVRVKDDVVQKFWYEVIQEDVPEEEDDKGPRLVQKFNEALVSGPGAELPTAKGTWFGAAEAVSYVIDHEQGRSQDTRMHSAWFGRGQSLKTRAWSIALDHAKEAA